MKNYQVMKVIPADVVYSAVVQAESRENARSIAFESAIEDSDVKWSFSIFDMNWDRIFVPEAMELLDEEADEPVENLELWVLSEKETQVVLQALRSFRDNPDEIRAPYGADSSHHATDAEIDALIAQFEEEFSI